MFGGFYDPLVRDFWPFWGQMTLFLSDFCLPLTELAPPPQTASTDTGAYWLHESSGDAESGGHHCRGRDWSQHPAHWLQPAGGLAHE